MPSNIDATDALYELNGQLRQLRSAVAWILTLLTLAAIVGGAIGIYNLVN